MKHIGWFMRYKQNLLTPTAAADRPSPAGEGDLGGEEYSIFYPYKS